MASAMQNYQYRLLQDQIWYEECSEGGGGGDTTTSPAPSGGAADLSKVYVLGDSITFGANGSKVGTSGVYVDELKKAGAKDVMISASGGGNLANAGSNGTNSSGISSIRKDKDFLKDTKTVVIAMGTNNLKHGTSVNLESEKPVMKEAIDAIKESGSSAKIYWVDIAISGSGVKGASGSGGTGPASLTDIANNMNAKVIYPGASELGYSIISWAKAVDPSLDPSKQTKPVAESKLLADGIHPADYSAYRETIINGLKGGSTGGTTTPATTPSDSGNLSKDEKITKLLIPLFPASSAKSEILGHIEKYKFGGMSTLGDSTAFDKAFFDDAKSKAGGSFVPMTDEESKGIARYGTIDKTAGEMGGMPTDQVKELGKNTGEKLKGYGIEVDWAPVLDIRYDNTAGSNHLNGGSRAFGRDAKTVTEKAGAFAEGLAAGGIKPTYKHFPGLGRANANTDEDRVDLRSSDLYTKGDIDPFKTLANKNSALVMLTNAVIDGTPAPLSPAVIEKLKGDVGFSGAIITDDLSPLSRWWGKGLPEIITDSLKAGAHLMLFTWPGDAVMDQIIDKVKKDVPKDVIDDAYSKYQSVAGSPAPTETPEADTSCCGSGSGATTVSTGDGGGCGEKGYFEGKQLSKPNKDQIWSFFKGKGLSDEAVAGIMGNSQVESAFMPDADNGRTMGFAHPSTGQGCVGIFQWCDRRPNLESFAKERGKEWDCLGIQLEFAWHEITGSEKAVMEPLKGVKSAAEGARVWNTIYERSGEVGQNRVEAADAILKEYTGKGGGSLGSSESSSGGSCSDSGDTSVPPAECGATVAETRKLVESGKLKSINGPGNLEDDLKMCGKVNNGSNCVGVTPEILRAVIAITKHIDSKGLGPVTFANFNKGHGCDGLKHPNGRAVDMWYGECNGDQIYTKPKCSETVKWILEHHKEYDITMALHSPCAAKEYADKGCVKDDLIMYDGSEGEMLHIGVGPGKS